MKKKMLVKTGFSRNSEKLRGSKKAWEEKNMAQLGENINRESLLIHATAFFRQVWPSKWRNKLENKEDVKSKTLNLSVLRSVFSLLF